MQTLCQSRKRFFRAVPDRGAELKIAIGTADAYLSGGRRTSSGDAMDFTPPNQDPLDGSDGPGGSDLYGRGDAVLDRVKAVARSITERVRRVSEHSQNDGPNLDPRSDTPTHS